MRPIVALGFTAAVVVFVAGVEAQTLYKLIDRNGKVTYSEKAPKDFDGQVIPLNIDPKANTATLPKPAPRDEAAAATARASEDRLKAAREKLEAARKALADARESPGEGDIARIGRKGGGTRPEPTEGYQRRLEKLERDAKEAEEELRKLERGR